MFLKKTSCFIIVFLSISLFNSIAAELQYKILGEEKTDEDFGTLAIHVSVEKYYSPDEYKQIVCDMLKNVKQDNNKRITLRINFYYKKDTWTILDEISGLLGGDPKTMLIASYHRNVYPDEILSSLNVYYDSAGMRLNTGINLFKGINFDHTCDCK